MARFCSECGSPLSDDAKFCNNCGAPCTPPETPTPARQPIPPAYQPVSQPGPYYERNPYNPAPAAPYYNAPQAQPPVPQKSKKGLIIALIAVAVVLIAGVVLLIVLKPFGGKSDSGKDTEATTATTATEKPVAPTQPATDAPTEPATAAPTTGKGGASIQDVLDQLTQLEMSPDPDFNDDLALLYEYQYADDSDLREDMYEMIVGYYGEGEDSLWSIVTGVYGTIINWKVEITDVYPCTGEELSDMIDDLISFGCKVDAIQEIVKADYTQIVTGSEYSDEGYYYLAFIKADGKWYYSYYL